MRTSLKQFQQLTLDSFAIISDWYHYAILELIRVKTFKPDAQWVSRALGLTRSEVNIAVERLQRVGLLKIDAKGRWIDTSNEGNATNITGEASAAAARKLQKQILEKSIVALEMVPIEFRNHTSMTFAMNPKDLGIAKDIIKRFRRELADALEQTKNPTQVYHLNVSLYPVSKLNEGETP